MEVMVDLLSNIWQKKSVFVTGHTGFKGGWLCLWLNELGSQIHGYALEPSTQPSLFEVANIKNLLSSNSYSDLRDLSSLVSTLKAAQPEVVFHLAAQPLVRESYADPIGTFSTNVMGTANLLEAVRRVDSVWAVIIITTDKVYINREWVHPYREVDRLGGRDPYSASKAACEIVVDSYRQSFFTNRAGKSVAIATARAGNVIGGGDWSMDRLAPDCLKAFSVGESAILRYSQAVRPWQHVLEPISGYLRLAEYLINGQGEEFATAWNFGPDFSGDCTVEKVAQSLAQLWGQGATVKIDRQTEHPHEAGLLRLDITKARTLLNWHPRWSLNQALQATVDWHRAWLEGKDMQSYSQAQIKLYQDSLNSSGDFE